MGRIRVLSDQVANQIAAGEVVDRPASVVKELLENSLDAGANRIRVEVEAGGRKLIRIADDGCGMSRDDALLAFERHATSKLRTANDLLSIATLGFRGEALPSIASVSRVTLETSTGEPEETGTRLEIAGGNILHVDDAAVPRGTTLSIADLFFNTPARRKFLRAESTELAHVTALVTHYALVHPEKHFELVSSSHTLVSAPPVTRTAERIYQIFGKETLAQLLPVAAETKLDRAGLPEPPPWKRDPDEPARDPGQLRLSGFYSKPELQKLNRNSIYIFVNKRLIRDRLLLHAITEAYRNVIPPTSYPVVLLFLEMPPEEVDVNVHPAKTEVRFRQQNLIHDFVRDSLRTALIKARPAAGFLAALDSAPLASPTLMPPSTSPIPGEPGADAPPPEPDSEPIVAGEADTEPFSLTPRTASATPVRLPFEPGGTRPGGFAVAGGLAATAAALLDGEGFQVAMEPDATLADSSASAALATAQIEAEQAAQNLNHLGSLKALGQLRESFILATGEDGLWIIDQHVAHERVLFEKILRERNVENVQRQRLLMPLLVELKPWQMVVFAEIADELERNGFEVEPFGPQTLAVKAAPVGLDGTRLERMLTEVIEQSSPRAEQDQRNEDLRSLKTRIAASIACHSAIKVNTPLDPARMDWLLLELAKTQHPTSCPHGRPIALLYSWKEIQRAFHRI
ncbi:DNA mismatch repair endonuclease MutL [Occallatibacter riparius]|uniref:DNA mismatch repair protein MutL n=1 Tax=Occallatibacter riparius TaxID=1002689 RepID=A0A9J7BWH2_9BACT|nr:DNA mismatch repair endonuclease MutL [Occallatibacter riparius]UWZ86162.1 DNA mismatch repair endonuclease MutL [Occallatibacter riparius]